MKKYLSLCLILLAALCLSVPIHSQTSVTSLQMGTHWDDGTPVAGTVTLGKVNSSGPDTVVYTITLSSGWCSASTAFVANSFYNVTLVASDGTQLAKFPVVTALINPSNLKRAVITMVFRKADKSLANANIQVSMGF